jgi:hypothetical protein
MALKSTKRSNRFLYLGLTPGQWDTLENFIAGFTLSKSGATAKRLETIRIRIISMINKELSNETDKTK